MENRLAFYLKENKLSRDTVVIEMTGTNRMEISMKDALYISEIMKIEFERSHLSLMDKICAYMLSEMMKNEEDRTFG